MKVRWRQLKKSRDWPPPEDLVLVTIRNEKDTEREVTVAYWTEERENWSFKEWYPHHEAVAWTKLPPPYGTPNYTKQGQIDELLDYADETPPPVDDDYAPG